MKKVILYASIVAATLGTVASAQAQESCISREDFAAGIKSHMEDIKSSRKFDMQDSFRRDWSIGGFLSSEWHGVVGILQSGATNRLAIHSTSEGNCQVDVMDENGNVVGTLIATRIAAAAR